MTYDYKQDFPIFQHTDVAYIDNAATAQRPQCVLDAVADFYRCHNANPLRGLYPLSVEATNIYEQARETVRDFIGARSAREIVFTRNTTESLNLVAYSYGLTHVKAGDEVLVSIMEHHSDLLPWQMVCRQTGAELKFIECAPDGSVDLRQIESLITERTKIVAMTQVSNVLGRKYPVQEVAAMAHKKGAVMVVDGAQSTPHMPVNVQELGADFFAFSGHKIFGPMGIGGLYGREELLEEMPPFLSGGEMIESVTRTGAVYAELPHKFEAGTVNAAGAAGLAAAIRYVQSVGFDTIRQREHDLTETYVAYQVAAAFSGLTAEQAVRCVIAYEPLWAIGTGNTATSAQAQEVCASIRATLAKLYDADTAKAISILYGGSMNAGNAAELLAQPDIDGGLIGGASLKPVDFSKIIAATAQGACE